MFEKKFFFIINLLMKTKINILIDNFVKKILEIENSSNNLENKINSINELLMYLTIVNFYFCAMRNKFFFWLGVIPLFFFSSMYFY